MTVLIVDDHAAIRKSVRSNIAECGGLKVVGEGANGEEAIAQTGKLHPDLVIMDVSMPVMDGFSAAEIIKRNYPETRILLFSMHTIQEFVEMARRMGLSGYVPKQDGPLLQDAVEAVLHDQTFFPN